MQIAAEVIRHNLAPHKLARSAVRVEWGRGIYLNKPRAAKIAIPVTAIEPSMRFAIAERTRPRLTFPQRVQQTFIGESA